jgi:hypothetical protein
MTLGLTGTPDFLTAEQIEIMNSVYNVVSETFLPSVYEILPHEILREYMIYGLPHEIPIINQAQERMYADKSDTFEILYTNEMKIKVLESKEEWF